MKKTLLGVKIDDVDLDQAVLATLKLLKKPGKHYIVTPNPEILVMAQNNQELKRILNAADLSIPDGVGLKLSGDIVCNTPGTDLLQELAKSSEDLGFTVGFLGGKDGVAKTAAERLQKKYPKMKVAFASGEKDHPKADLLFVALGAPKQEFWIEENLPKIDVKVAMAVGGAFDYISGQVPRAPKFLRNLGLEWLFRLIVQPWRIKRQLALLKYLMLIWNNDNHKRV